MSGAEIIAIISILGPALKASADLVKSIRERRKKKKDEKAFMQRELEKCLGEGELELHNTYHRYVRQLGDPFRKGDDIARMRVNAHIVEADSMRRMLQLAWDHESDIQNLTQHWRSAASIPREAKQTMEELSIRIMGIHPAFIQSIGHMPAPESPQSPRNPICEVNQLPAIKFTRPSIPSHETPAIMDVSTLPKYGEVPAAPGPRHYGREPSPATSSLHRNSSSFHSPPPTSHPHQPNSPEGPVSFRSSMVSNNSVETTSSINSAPSPKPKPSPFQRAISGGSIQRSRPRAVLTGRPEKSNGYHGFCKGAWTIQTDLKKGMPFMTIGNGLSGNIRILQCDKCRFRGDPFGPDKKHATTDPAVRKSKCGIKYRYIFLAKSHQTCKEWFMPGENTEQKMLGQNFGCLFCCAEGYMTDVFGGVESLMNHILVEHNKGVRQDTNQKLNCISGRTAENNEAFDINIPFVTEPQESTSPRPDSARFAEVNSYPLVKDREESLIDVDFDESDRQAMSQAPSLFSKEDKFPKWVEAGIQHPAFEGQLTSKMGEFRIGS